MVEERALPGACAVTRLAGEWVAVRNVVRGCRVFSRVAGEAVRRKPTVDAADVAGSAGSHFVRAGQIKSRVVETSA